MLEYQAAMTLLAPEDVLNIALCYGIR